jgi:hypothetical protein
MIRQQLHQKRRQKKQIQERLCLYRQDLPRQWLEHHYHHLLELWSLLLVL